MSDYADSLPDYKAPAQVEQPVADYADSLPDYTGLANTYAQPQQPPPQGFWANAGDFIRSAPNAILNTLSRHASALGNAAQIEMGQEQNVPDAQTVKKGLEDNVFGQQYQPRGTGGRYGTSTFESLADPNTYLMPGGLGAKILFGVLSGLGGQAGEDIAGTPGRAIGSLIGGVGSGVLTNAIPKTVNAPAVTRDMVEAAKTANYEAPAVNDLRIAPSAGPATVRNVEDALLQNELDPQNAGEVIKRVSALNNARFEQPTTQSNTILSGPGYHIAEDVTKPAPLQVADFDLARQALSDVPPDQWRAAGIARGVIDKYLGNIPQADVVAGDAAAANAKLLAAREDAAALFREKQISDALGRAENQAGSTYSGQNLDNATRQQLRPILNDKMGIAKRKTFQDYTDQEIDALRTAVNGTKTENTIRGASKMLGGGHGLGAFGTAAATYASLPHDLPWYVKLGAAGATAATGGVLNSAANALRASRASALTDLLLQRSALGKQLAAQAAQQTAQAPSPVLQQLWASTPISQLPQLRRLLQMQLPAYVPSYAEPQEQPANR
jgi:hypothetical protein